MALEKRDERESKNGKEKGRGVPFFLFSDGHEWGGGHGVRLLVSPTG